MRKTFKNLEPGDLIWQVLETEPGIWEIITRPVVSVQWPYQDNYDKVAINGGFVLNANANQDRCIYMSMIDAMEYRLRQYQNENT